MSKGQQIKTLRTALNLSRRQLAELTGLTTQTVVNIESYNINKNSDILLKYLLNFKDEAIENLNAMAESIKNFKEEL